MLILKKIRELSTVFKKSANDLSDNDPLRMAGATAFFTSFALPPVLMIIVRTFGIFLNKRIIGTHILDRVGNVIGQEGRMQILTVIKSVRGFQLNVISTSLIFIFLLFVSTTLFMIVRGSINQLWNIRITKKRNFRAILFARLKAVVIILFTGLLFITVMGIDMIQAYLGTYLHEISPQLGAYVYGTLNHIVSLLVVTIWFYVLFWFLPDGKPQWTVAMTGAFVTGVLFTIGKYVLRWLLSGNIQAIYGTSGALVLILLFVFYSSLILYYGAAFTKVWGKYCHKHIEPRPYASAYHLSKDHVTKPVPMPE